MIKNSGKSRSARSESSPGEGIESSESVETGVSSQLSQVRLIVFDWDGTLEDSTSSIVDAIEQALILIGKVPPDRQAMKDIIGLNAIQGLAALYPDEDAHQLARECANAAQNAPRHSQLYPGVREVLQQLSDGGFWLAIATGKARGGLDHALQVHELTSLFLTTRTADDAPSKPHPAMMDSILRELGVEPHEAVMIGDTSYDLQLAANAGVRSIGVSCGSHSEQSLQDTGLAVAILSDVTKLPDLFIDNGPRGARAE